MALGACRAAVHTMLGCVWELRRWACGARSCGCLNGSGGARRDLGGQQRMQWAMRERHELLPQAGGGARAAGGIASTPQAHCCRGARSVQCLQAQRHFPIGAPQHGFANAASELPETRVLLSAPSTLALPPSACMPTSAMHPDLLPWKPHLRNDRTLRINFLPSRLEQASCSPCDVPLRAPLPIPAGAAASAHAACR